MTYRTGRLMHRFDLRLPPALRQEVLTVHDLAPLRFKDEGSLPRHVAEAIRRAAAVICPSAFAASEIEEQFGKVRLHVIPNGVTSERLSNSAARTPTHLPWMGGVQSFLLHSGGCTERKNLASLADAWRRVSKKWPDLHLVLCGPPDPRRDRLFGELPRTCMPGRVTDSQLAWLMGHAEAVVVPSTYEGFGMPALEAMALGTPVVAANSGSLPEVCGEAAELVAPTGEGLAVGIEHVLEDQEWSKLLRSRGPVRAALFTWEESARRHLSVYEEVLAS